MIFYAKYYSIVGVYSFYHISFRPPYTGCPAKIPHRITIPPRDKFCNFLCILLAATRTSNIRISIASLCFFLQKHFEKKINFLYYCFRIKSEDIHFIEFILPTNYDVSTFISIDLVIFNILFF